jgi:hypothetical protein
MPEDSIFACLFLVFLIGMVFLLFGGSPDTVELASDAALYIIPALQ